MAPGFRPDGFREEQKFSCLEKRVQTTSNLVFGKRIFCFLHHIFCPYPKILMPPIIAPYRIRSPCLTAMILHSPQLLACVFGPGNRRRGSGLMTLLSTVGSAHGLDEGTDFRGVLFSGRGFHAAGNVHRKGPYFAHRVGDIRRGQATGQENRLT